MSYKLAIFDLDGTILNTLDDLTDSVNHALELFGYPHRTRAEVRAFTGNGAEMLIKRSLPAECSKETVEKVLAEYKSYYSAHSDIKTRPYDRIMVMLEKLRTNGCKIAVLSNKPDFPVQLMCQRFFGSIFDYTAGEKDGIPRKPAPDGVNAIMSILDIRREDAVFIGDSEVDIETAKNAEMPCITVTWGFRDRDMLVNCGAEAVADTVDELTDILLKNN